MILFNLIFIQNNWTITFKQFEFETIKIISAFYIVAMAHFRTYIRIHRHTAYISLKCFAVGQASIASKLWPLRPESDVWTKLCNSSYSISLPWFYIHCSSPTPFPCRHCRSYVSFISGPLLISLPLLSM